MLALGVTCSTNINERLDYTRRLTGHNEGAPQPCEGDRQANHGNTKQ